MLKPSYKHLWLLLMYIILLLLTNILGERMSFDISSLQLSTLKSLRLKEEGQIYYIRMLKCISC